MPRVRGQRKPEGMTEVKSETSNLDMKLLIWNRWGMEEGSFGGLDVLFVSWKTGALKYMKKVIELTSSVLCGSGILVLNEFTTYTSLVYSPVDVIQLLGVDII